RASLKPAPAAAGAVRARMRPLARAPSRVRGEAPVGRGGRARLKAAVLKPARVASPREFESPPFRSYVRALASVIFALAGFWPGFECVSWSDDDCGRPREARRSGPAAGVSPRGPSGRQPGTGRKPTHSARIMRRTLRALATTRLDGRSAIARGDSPDADRRGARQEPRATRPRAE